MVTVGPREKAILCQTIVPLLKGLEGKDVIVELKNDINIFGFLEQVDCFLNLNMTGVLMMKSDGTKYLFDFFFLQRKNLRYVRIPNDISIKRLLQDQVDIVTGKKAQDARRRAVEKRANWLKRKHHRNMNTGDLAPIVVETSRLSTQRLPESVTGELQSEDSHNNTD